VFLSFHCLPPDLRAELVAALDAIQAHLPKGGKRKCGDAHDPFADFQCLIARITNDNEGNHDEDGEDGEDNEDSEDSEDNEDNEDDKDGSMDICWIDRWIDKPSGEGGHKNKEDRPGWGKPRIMDVAKITEGQYSHYLVSLSFLQLSSLTQFHPEIRSLSVQLVLRHQEDLQQKLSASPS